MVLSVREAVAQIARQAMTNRILDTRIVADDSPIDWVGALIHHSATGPTVTAKAIADYHVKERGWLDVGYHGLVELAGGGYKFAPGRSLAMHGAHCPGKNRTHLGLCLIGNYANATPPIAQLEVAAEILAEWCVAFDFSPEDIYPHKAFRKTECPGIVDILGLRARVAAILAFG